MTTTYILAGFDYNDAFKEEVAAWEERVQKQQDVVILRPTPGESFAETVRRIKGPADVILAAHGSKYGKLEWEAHEKGATHHYEELFEALPRTGIRSVTITSCYGGLALSALAKLPSGTIVQSIVGSKTPAYESAAAITELAAEEITPLNIMLEAYDHTDLSHYERQYNSVDEDDGLHAEKYNPEYVLPTVIAIGGNPPTLINLEEKMATISTRLKAGTIDHQALDRAIADVNAHCAMRAPLKVTIDTVVSKLASGADMNTFTLEEKRIGYAITVANLYEDGTMSREIAKTQAFEAVQGVASIVNNDPAANVLQKWALPISRDR